MVSIHNTPSTKSIQLFAKSSDLFRTVVEIVELGRCEGRWLSEGIDLRSD